MADSTRRPPKSPSIDLLRTERNAAYAAADKAGVAYSPQDYDNLLTEIVKDVKGQNISPTRHGFDWFSDTGSQTPCRPNQMSALTP